jgi:hypothetical protein
MASGNPNFKVESNLEDFQEEFNKYVQWNKRAIPDIVNQKLYFIALRAMELTKTADPDKIKNELNAPSKSDSRVTLGELLTILDLKKRGKLPKRSKTFRKNFPTYLQRFINKRTSRTQFLRSGWLPAVKKLDYWNRKGDTNSISFSRRFAPKKPQGIKQYGKDKGDVKPALLNTWGNNCRGTIFNFTGTEGKQRSKTAHTILQAGLDRAVKEEIRSMRIYSQRKYLEQHRRMASKGILSIG